MCKASEYAENTRDARNNEDLVATRAPFGIETWLTEPGKPECAVCIQNTALLAVQTPNGPVRGANFVQRSYADMAGNYDFVRFLDGERELLAVNYLPEGSGVRVVSTFWVSPSIPDMPTVISSTIHAPAPATSNPVDAHSQIKAENDEALIPVNRNGGKGKEPIVHQGRRRRRIPFFEPD
jgi:hypothetical protein